MLSLRRLLSMSTPLRLATLITISSLLTQRSLGQTTSDCDPTVQSGCPSDPALGKSTTIDFRSGESSHFTATGSPTYGSDGVSFTIAESGDAPLLTSNWYIMFGQYEVTMKAAPGQGIVSTLVLQSDDLDEIDWELLGSYDTQGQTNYFGKGEASTSPRAVSYKLSDTTYQHTYGVQWTSSQITWSVDGTIVRTLRAQDAFGQYPQTPCRLKIGAWAGGDPSNAPGTIAWAGGETDYTKGPYTMTVQSVSVVDFSTGSSYSYQGSSGTWESIQPSGGKVNGNMGQKGSTMPTLSSPNTVGPTWLSDPAPSSSSRVIGGAAALDPISTVFVYATAFSLVYSSGFNVFGF